MFLSESRPIVLYGGGTWQAEKFYYQFAESQPIVYVANSEAGGEFHGHRVIVMRDIPDIGKYHLIITTPWEEFKRVKREIEARGFKEFYDFFYWEAYLKKIAVVHGNCYTESYVEFLQKSQDFTAEYFIYPVRPIHLNKEKRLDENLLGVCDLFIHQEIRKENRFSAYFSDEYILPRLKPVCKQMVVPNLKVFADILFPREYIVGAPKAELANSFDPILFVGNRIIDEAFEKGKDIAGIMAEFEDVNRASPEEKKRCREIFLQRMEYLKEREEKWDVKIRDYILANYQECKLFVDLSHPSRTLMMEICRRIGKALHLRDIEDISLDFDYEYYETFVMGWVKDALGLRFSDEFVRSNNRLGRPNRNKLGDGRMDLREYVREYVYWKFGKFLH